VSLKRLRAECSHAVNVTIDKRRGPGVQIWLRFRDSAPRTRYAWVTEPKSTATNSELGSSTYAANEVGGVWTEPT
jgi:hypothetical protein